MREDMPRRFLEPSGGKRGKFPRKSKKFQPRGEDNTPDIPGEGMKKFHAAIDPDSDRYAGTDFSVMRRFLRSRKGRPWDEVYSEICEHADYRSYEGHHLREWIGHLVEHNCKMQDGEVYTEHGHRIGLWWCQFYIHPEKRTLEWVEPRRFNRRTKSDPTVLEMDEVLYHKHDGIWYRVRFKDVPKKKEKRGTYEVYDTIGIRDVFLDKDPPKHMNPWCYWSFTRVLSEKYGYGDNGCRYCCWKQSANSREIEKLKDKYKDLVT